MNPQASGNETGSGATTLSPGPWAGFLVAAFAVAVGYLVGVALDVGSPLAAVADKVIDGAPKPVKDWAISSFGTSDKLVLGIGIFVILGFTAWGAIRAAGRPWVPVLIVGVLMVVGLWAQSPLEAADVITTVSMAAAAMGAMAFLGWRVESPATAPAPNAAEVGIGQSRAEPMPTNRWQARIDRRSFFNRAAALSAGTVAVGAGGWALSRRRDETLLEAAPELPRPASADRATDLAAFTGNQVDGQTSFVTPNDDFYRIDTAFSSPRVRLQDWTLTIDGMVERPITLSYEDLLDRRVVERAVTLCCVSNEVGGPYIGNALWLGVPLADLLEEVGVEEGADQIASESVDGWTCGFPTEAALDGRDAMVALGMNGRPLPIDHGFPARLVVPGLYGYVSATKWLERITLTRWQDFDGYWIPKGWSKEGPVKTQCRIDVPRSAQSVEPGTIALAGVAWAQQRGIDAVEVRIDGGEWQKATLSNEYSVDTWRQWFVEWDAVPGDHVIEARATDSTGATQTSERSPVDPDGATGYPRRTVTVS